MSRATPEPKVLPLAALAAQHGVTPQTLINAARRGELPVMRIGRRFFTSREIAAEYFRPKLLTQST